MSLFRQLPRHGRVHPAVLGVLLVVLVGVAVWLWTRPGSQPDVNDGREVAEEFLKLLETGKPGDAWTATTAEFKSAQGQEAFIRDVAELEYLQQPLEFVSVQTVEVASQPRSEFLYRARTGKTIRIVLGWDDGDWKVDRWTR